MMCSTTFRSSKDYKGKNNALHSFAKILLVIVLGAQQQVIIVSFPRSSCPIQSRHILSSRQPTHFGFSSVLKSRLPKEGQGTKYLQKHAASGKDEKEAMTEQDEDELKKDGKSTTSLTSRRKFIQDQFSNEIVESVGDSKRRNLIINSIALGLIGASGIASAQLYMSMAYTPEGFRRVSPTMFVAALGDPNANAGTGADQWGVWRLDPGPRGVFLNRFEADIERSENYVAPVGWKFDPNDWWVEEHGIIMESPQFPIKPGRYLVTGGRTVTTGLTIKSDGSWKLDDKNAKLYDVTHLPCRSARYHPIEPNASPKNYKEFDFPVLPGATMPNIAGYEKQDYAVLFLVGKAIEQ